MLVAGGGGGAAANIFCNQAGSGGGATGGNSTWNLVCTDGGNRRQPGRQQRQRPLGQGSQGADGDGISSAGGGGGGGYYGGSGGPAGLGGGGGSGFGVNAVLQNGVRSGSGVVTVAFGGAPTVTNVDPHAVPPARLRHRDHGTNFVPGATSVMFGTTPSPQVECSSSTQCNAVSPAGSGGVSIIVTANGQQSLNGNDDDYVYFGDPTITSISPSQGPQGTVVTIHGTNFMPPPWTNFVEFGPNIFATPTCTTPTECTVVSPAGLARSTWC